MQLRSASTLLLAHTLLACAYPAVAQAPQEKTVSVNGHTGKALVLQDKDQIYVNLTSLAQIANGTLSFQGGQIVLTLPAAAKDKDVAATDAAGDGSASLSRDFMRTGVEAVAIMREWRSALFSGMQNSLSVSGTWVNDYHARASESLRLASVAATTPGDGKAAQLLNNEFEHLQLWSSKVVAGRQALNAELAVTPQAFSNDPQYQNIVKCSRFLGQMLVSGAFAEDESCR